MKDDSFPVAPADALFSHLKLLEKMYEILRIVDPIKKSVIELKDGEIRETAATCFHFWQNNKICANCISMRAHQTRETVMKIEHTPEKLYMVSAVPVNYQNQPYIIELLKDVTHSLLFSNSASDNSGSLFTAIGALNDAVVKDSLTGLYNKRFVSEYLPPQFVKHAIENRPFSLILGDIDRFKLVNDTYGHPAGDHVIKTVAEKMSSCIRADTDWIARYGGEEYFVFLSGADETLARTIAERMRTTIENTPIPYSGATIKTTMSFGICTVGRPAGISWEAAIECADKKLYQAKQSGRNRTIS